MWCLCCSRNPGQERLCRVCYKSLKFCDTRFPCGGALYEYEARLRHLLLRAKVEHDLQSLICLVDLFIKHPVALSELKRAELIVAVPSSLKGRILGSWDLAFVFAKSAADISGSRLSLAPISSFWKFRKQAFRANRVALSLNFPNVEDNIPTLLVDDVMTSGHSLRQLAFKLNRSNCRFLTLASAYRDCSF